MEGKEARFGPLLVVFGFPSRGICCINHRRRRHHRQIFSFAFPFSLSFSSSSISSFPPHPAFLLFFFFLHFCVSLFSSLVSLFFSYGFCFSPSISHFFKFVAYILFLVPLLFPLHCASLISPSILDLETKTGFRHGIFPLFVVHCVNVFIFFV